MREGSALPGLAPPRLRERIREQVVTGIGDGNGAIAWSGSNRRIPADFDG
jgi:hypothetical protein